MRILLSVSLLTSFSFQQVIQAPKEKYSTNTTQEIVLNEGDRPTKIAFGSCFQQFKFTSNIFHYVQKEEPQLWIWTGDAAYANYQDNKPERRTREKYIEGFDYIYDKFNNTLKEPNYAAFKEQVPIIGVWDDHDYGRNDAGSDFFVKHEMRQIYLDFIEEFPDSERRMAKHRGIYQDYILETKEGIKVLIVLFDDRFHYERHEKGKERIGEEQWNWFDKVLAEHSQVDFTILISGVQILADRYLPVPEAFKEKSRKRMLEILQKHQRSGVLTISGDVHNTQYLKIPCTSAYLGYTLPEIVSSGLTHTMGTFSFRMIELVMDAATNKRFKNTEIEAKKYNYGLLEFYKDQSGDKIVKTSTRTNKQGEDGVIFSQTFSLKKDLQFKPLSSLPFKKSCQACLSHQSPPLLLQAVMENVIIGQNFWLYYSIGFHLGMIYGYIGIYTAAFYLLIEVVKYLRKKCKERKEKKKEKQKQKEE